MKPPGRRSAARALLSLALQTVAEAYPRVALLDLSEYSMPWFDGRSPASRGDPAISYAAECMERSGALLLSVPAYWAGVSGAFKNFVDCVCGPAYDLPCPPRTAFVGKDVGVLVVGADDESATAGVEQAGRILASAGARLVGRPVTLSNPRARDDRAAAPIGPVVELAVLLLRRMHDGSAGRAEGI
jgi:NAD(P)H-dependent FMN reductase